MTAAARVASLYKYPVKSLLGERVAKLDVEPRGCVGDRLWSVRTAEGKIGSGKSTRRFAAVIGLLQLRASEVGGRIAVAFPDGHIGFVDDCATATRLTRLVGQPVEFARETSVSHFDDGPVSLLGTASVAAVAEEREQEVDHTRFRPNILLETHERFVEDGWVGRRLRIGTARLHVAMRSPRCVMVNMETADLPGQPGNLAAIGRLNDATLGVVATVVEPGRITVGDDVFLD